MITQALREYRNLEEELNGLTTATAMGCEDQPDESADAPVSGSIIIT